MGIEVKAKDIFLLEGGKKAWIVEDGALNIFFTKICDDGSYGRRSWLFTAEKGDMLAGFDFNSKSPYRIIACASPHAVIEEKRLDFLKEGPRTADSIASAAKLLNGLADKLTYALVGYKLPPKSLKFIEAGDAAVLDDGYSYGARPNQVLWIKLLEGEAEVLGSYMAFFKGHAGYFPVTNRFWFKVYAESAEAGARPSVSACDTEKFLEFADAAESVSAFHAVVLWLLIEKNENADAEEKARLVRRIERDADIVEGNLCGFASIIDSKFGAYSAKAEDCAEFETACRLVGAAAKINIVMPAAIKKGEKMADPVGETARVSMVRHRKVLLRDDWWTKDSGPILAFFEDGRPAALIPESTSSYKMHIPGGAAAVKVGRKESAMLSGIGYMFYRPLPARPLKLSDISMYAVNAGIISDVVMMLAAGVVLSLINMLTPMATGIAFDTLIPEIERSQMAQMTAVLISSSFCILLFQFFRSIATLRFENKIDASLQAAVWDRLLALPAPFFRKFSTGDLAMRAMSINTIRQTISGTVFSSFLTGTFAVFNFALLFYYNMKLALISVVLTAVAMLFYAIVMFMQYKYSKLSMELDGKLSGLVFGIIGGIAKFRVAGAESRAFGLWAKLFKQKKEIPVYVLTNVMAVFNSVYMLICSAIFFWCIITYSESDMSMTSGSFVAFNSAFTTFFSGMMEISSSMMSFLSVFTLYERAKPILEAIPEFDETREDPGELNGGVEVCGVTFKYEGSLIPALNDVSISVKPGEFAAIVGPSGSGKSTLIRLLLGFDKPVAGSLLFDGQDLGGIDVRAVRRQIGVVLQNGQLMSGTIMSNIIGSSTLTIDDAWEAARSAGLEDDIKMMPMGMHTMISEGASSISGGQKQRILIARALVKKPRIIIFDEATSALDNKTQAAVSESLEKLHATRIVIAHRLSTIIKADRIFVIEAGRLVETGTYDELIKQNGLFKKLAQRQIA
jgi:NHLM bacteriocin system ABC transporter ATP-binding protein